MHFITINGRFPRKNDTDELERGKGGLEITEHGLDLVRTGGVFAETGLADDGHARVVADLLQLRCEHPERVLAHRPLRCEARDGPDADFHASEKLLTPHVPDSLVRQCLLLRLPENSLMYLRDIE